MASYRIGSWLFLRGLGLIYLIAFVSLWVQVEGLVGSDGILPVADFLDRVREYLGAERFWRVPTLLWLADGDLALHLLCGAGVALSVALIVGVAPIPVLLALWVCYLSLVQGGQTFLSFQWDILLLETGFCALFLAPTAGRPTGLGLAARPPRRGLWLVWLLLFKLMVLSGAVKLLGLDDTWWGLTALDVHYWTQPLPNGLSWYAHQLPPWLDRLSVLITYGIEILLPVLIFAGRLGRRTVAAGTVLLMLAISWTGNYGFFNLLTVVLCLSLVDDAVWRRWLPATLHPAADSPEDAARGPVAGRWCRLAGHGATVAVVALVALSALTFVREVVRTVPPRPEGPPAAVAFAERWLLGWSEGVLRWSDPFRTVNGYGLFRSMTTRRPEIVLEGSRDGVTWMAYEFPYKPGDPARRPPTVAPHMPRLDWQMWFAALSPRRAQPWLAGLMRGVLRGSPEVIALLAEDPFPEEPPRYLRLVSYDYRFTTPGERQDSGNWWTREHQGLLTAPISLEQLEGSGS